MINANWFRDPVNLNILPDYTTKVPKKDMHNLGTIKTKLGQGGYESPLEMTLRNQTDCVAWDSFAMPKPSSNSLRVLTDHHLSC